MDIVPGVRHIPRPKPVHIFLTVARRDRLSKCTLVVGSESLPISRRVAEILIARGMGYCT